MPGLWITAADPEPLSRCLLATCRTDDQRLTTDRTVLPLGFVVPGFHGLRASAVSGEIRAAMDGSKSLDRFPALASARIKVY